MTLLEVRGVTVKFGGKVAVDEVDLEAEDSTITGLIGPNGAGKTTLFNVITGLQEPTKGSVLLGGTNISRLRPYKRARLGMARTFQRLELFGSLTVRENISISAARRAGRTERVATKVKVDEIIERLGLGKVADVRADSLPTGQGRLVELARALAQDPALLLLDEPASGQDERETRHFADVLRDLAGAGTAILLVEHDMSLVMDVCQQIYVLDFGRMMAAGTPEEIRHDPNVQAAYLGAADV